MTNIFPVLTNGGTAGFFWVSFPANDFLSRYAVHGVTTVENNQCFYANIEQGWIIVTIGYILVYASLSEMASMAPTSGGQYHWCVSSQARWSSDPEMYTDTLSLAFRVSEFAPPSCQRFLSYIVGWLCFTGWQSGLTAISFIAGTIIQGLIALNNPGYFLVPWHGTLLTIAVCAFAIFFNTVIASRLPLVEGSIVFLHISGAHERPFVETQDVYTLTPARLVHCDHCVVDAVRIIFPDQITHD